MFDEAYFKFNHSFFQEVSDPWMQCFLKLHVPSNYKNNKQYKLDALEALRRSNVYKTSKLNAEQIETNLLDCQHLSILSFSALCLLYGVNVALVLGNVCFTLGSEGAFPSHYVNSSGTLHTVPSSAFSDLFHVVHIGKPLNAVSYYTANELETIVSKIRKPKGTKVFMYNGIHSYVQEKLTAFSNPL
jgi:hypothetical protein